MSALDFLSVTGADGAVARSPMEALAARTGAKFEERDGWNVAVSYPAAPSGDTVTWCDTSHLPKLQLQGTLDPKLEYGVAARRDDAWWCRLTDTRALVIGKTPTVPEGLEDRKSVV